MATAAHRGEGVLTAAPQCLQMCFTALIMLNAAEKKYYMCKKHSSEQVF